LNFSLDSFGLNIFGTLSEERTGLWYTLAAGPSQRLGSDSSKSH
jgi:hypothetical protein